ncbi:MAG: hypothetical protein IIA88_11885 [Bacteroidetes bacterium]|nr:hypothetical protein [Bacteroidota bacterium]
MTKKAISFILAVTLYSNIYPQSEMTVFSATGRAGVATTFVTDYQTIGINPANLGMGPEFEFTHFNLGVSELAFSIYSKALSKKELWQSITDFDTTFLYQGKLQAAQAFIDAPLAINVDVTPLAFSVYYPEVGGFAISIRERVQWFSTFNELTSEILFLGYNAPYFDELHYWDIWGGDTTSEIISNNPSVPDSIRQQVYYGKVVLANPKKFSEILDGSKIQMAWFREYNFSYGIQLVKSYTEASRAKFATTSLATSSNISLYAGIGLKYIQGFGLIDISAEDGELEAFSALSPIFNIDYGVDPAPGNSVDTTNKRKFIPDPVGRGFGLDIGFNLRYRDKLTFGVAVTNIGSITWDGNVFTAKDDTLLDMDSRGFDSYNIFAEAEKITGDGGLFKWEGLKKKKVKLPTLIRAGVSYKIEEIAEVGFDMVISANKEAGSYEKAIFSIGGDLKPTRWLRLSTGFTFGGNYGFNIPIGIRIITGEEGRWEAGIASRDALTFFIQEGPTLSAGFGFLRFRF